MGGFQRDLLRSGKSAGGENPYLRTSRGGGVKASKSGDIMALSVGISFRTASREYVELVLDQASRSKIGVELREFPISSSKGISVISSWGLGSIDRVSL